MRLPDSDPLRQTVRRVVEETLAASHSAPSAPTTAAASRDTQAGPVAIGSDHSGFALKQHLVRFLRQELRVPVTDLGAPSTAPVDYPDIALAVAAAVREGRASAGIVIDGAGIGSTMAANKVRGIRAALCHDLFTARNSREHNNANVLVLGSNVVSRGAARRLVQVWLATPFAGGRHARRVEKITAIEASEAGRL